MNTIIVADFDQTLIRQNTLLTLYRRLTHAPLLFSVILALIKGRWPRNGLRTVIKEEMYRHMLRGKSESQLANAGQEIARHITLNEPVVSRVRQFQEQGYPLIVASASLTQVVEAILRDKGLAFVRVIGSRAEIENGKMNGRLIHGECFGKTKAHRIRQLRHAAYPGTKMIAFGNWPDDKPLLVDADEAYIVTGNAIKPWKAR
uniref:Haloacid Dehalogenase superfamily, subfamily IB, phosphoserine phosphatase-like n=1 Tax=Candidatus Kentrum sp. MB TaxID=2138164 RepID=A0A450XRB5_9GAMM|nr:MAG: Haloacid Dehalogenase superfamily, subfamily IB, phosphoserine phosphatase-like [Candidatus Kentron sp. MB]VFK34899.1 MAG: Haloacid Dehalogenase superfamily, subfamily IB, phosphoserine phosphatase-like [Candidatus Kentron sp. MB]VFK77053.1 MAG: Haloacid Dehalogenase superfamily, subfamily IB, phosphoserine phosphatase-like [Candidatus Kentron sp. MB]